MSKEAMKNQIIFVMVLSLLLSAYVAPALLWLVLVLNWLGVL